MESKSKVETQSLRLYYFKTVSTLLLPVVACPVSQLMVISLTEKWDVKSRFAMFFYTGSEKTRPLGLSFPLLCRKWYFIVGLFISNIFLSKTCLINGVVLFSGLYGIYTDKFKSPFFLKNFVKFPFFANFKCYCIEN